MKKLTKKELSFISFILERVYEMLQYDEKNKVWTTGERFYLDLSIEKLNFLAEILEKIYQKKIKKMRISNTTKTKKRAKEIILAYIKKNNLKEGYFKNSTAYCECGETDCITWYNGKVLLSVAICKYCGDDDTDADEVLEVL